MHLSSDRITLRATTLEDLPYVLETEAHPDNAAFIGQWTESDHEQALVDADIRHLLVEDAEENRIGYAILTGLTDPHKAINIKRIAIQAKGRGYGREAMRLLRDWAFRDTDTHRLWLDVKTFNTRARHVYESLGFVHEGTLRDSYWNGERFESFSVMSILKPEYEEIAGIAKS